MNEKTIWDFLLSKCGNSFGVAGLMGNLYAESRLESVCLQSSCSKKFGMSSAEYTKAVDNNTYTEFVTDGAGYGLAQWTYHTRKQGLYDMAKKCKVSVGDLKLQLEYLWAEIQKYTTVYNVLRNAKSVQEASDIVVLRYEKPKDVSDSNLQKRGELGKKYYNMFVESSCKEIILTADNVNIRAGNAKTYARLGQGKKNSIFEWIATSENNWHAIVYKNVVGWVSGEFSKLK